MRRLGPNATLALPPISTAEVLTDSSGWTVTDRRPQVGPGVSPPPSSKLGRKVSHSPNVKKAKSHLTGGTVPVSARGVPGERDLPRADVMDEEHTESPSRPTFIEDASSPLPIGAHRQTNAMKGRAIQNWLNHTLAQAGKPDGAISSTAAKQMQGLSQFGIDNAALEKLGLDSESAERVYRAMFVYSQGLHAVLQEAVGRAKSSSAALLVLWRAFTAVLEHAGQSEEKGESLAALVQRGNEDEKAKIESQFRDQVSTLQNQTQKLVTQRRGLQEELGRLREDEMRLRSESDMYRTEHEMSMQKYEKEIKLRVDAEVRFLDKTRWAESLQEDLDKEYKQSALLQARFKEEVAMKESAQCELESYRNQVKVLEGQAQSFKQAVMEAQQARSRHEQQVGQLKQQHDRMERKNLELKEQLEHEQESVKRLTEQCVSQQREIRKLERQGEDDSHVRKELQSERDTLRDKLERTEKDLAEVVEERRNLQKQLQDLNMEHRSKLLDLKRKSDHLDRIESQLGKVQQEHSVLLDAHRILVTEADNLRQDVTHLDAQCLKESELRKQLQYEKKVQAGQLQTQQIQLDSTNLAMQSLQKELQEVTEAKVKLESVVRDTKSAMQKLTLEHQVQLKANTMKVAMLEKVISDERNERRNLVSETQEVSAMREEAVDQIKKRDLEIRELRRQRLDKEEEVDRFKVLLKAQEQRNSEQLVTIDRYHAAVANHDAEMRQMQVLLECERQQAMRELQEIQDSYAAAKQTLQLRIEHWRFSYEDVLSQLNFNPAAHRMQVMEAQIEEFHAEIRDLKGFAETEREKTSRIKEQISEKQSLIDGLQKKLVTAKGETDLYKDASQRAMGDLEQQSMLRQDAEQQCDRIKLNIEAFDEMKAALELQVSEAGVRIEQLQSMMNKTMADASTQVIIETSENSNQTDLSYQYLESSARLNEERGRRERLTELKKASFFVEDPDACRDFVSREVCQAIPVSQVEMQFDGARGAVQQRVSMVLQKPPAIGGAMGAAASGPASGASTHRGSQARPSMAGTPMAPDPYPSAVRPPGQPPQGTQRSSQALRSSSAGSGPPAPGGLLHVNQVRSSTTTTTRSDTSPWTTR
mmetsp:Transcript_19003/g.53146  ORF Transcript_19003/g.53146 Transcript_19003/m.53146 type:complete len:1099 (+) Transcript_19003:62-3358(+)